MEFLFYNSTLMKKIICTCLIGLFFISLKAQNIAAHQDFCDSLHKLKKQGKLTNYEGISFPLSVKKQSFIVSHPAKHHSNKNERLNNNNSVMSTPCNCWVPRDTSFHAVDCNNPNGSNSSPTSTTSPVYQIDDASSWGIALPFSFCFYGNTVGTTGDSLYINSNGIVTFGANFTTFSPISFPCTSAGNGPGAAIAPFWSDVDTETPNTSGGVIYYKLTPTYMIIQWDSVGVYDHTGQINSFQLIITDGSDPILPAGNNVSFCFGEMQWACGDASGATIGTGFGYAAGGSPATVGINKGDGVNYSQISLFDTTVNNYTNPAGNPVSGIGWLVGRSFYFNTCGAGGGVPPVPLSGGANPCSGDTLSVCTAGDTLVNTVSFSPPNPSQTVSVTATAPSLGSNFSILNSTSGSTASLTFHVNTAGLSAPGNYNVSVTATNSGGLSTTVNYIIHINNSTPIPNPVIVVTPTITCGNTPPVITLTNSSAYSSWTWSNGATTATTSIASTGTVQVTVFQGGCQKTGSASVQIYPAPNPVISGALTYCTPTSTSTTIQTTVSGGTAPFSYNWNNGLASTYSLTATGTSTGTSYTVVVTDAHGCVGSASVTITSGSSTPLTITPRGSLCVGADTLFSSITNAASYTWTPAGGIGASDTAYIVNTPGIYHLSLTINGCVVSAPPFTLTSPVQPVFQIQPDTIICSGKSTTFTVSATPASSTGYSYAWYQGTTLLGTGNTITLSAAGTYVVSGVNNGNLCKASKIFQAVIVPVPSVSVTPHSPTYCQSIPDSIKAAVSGGTPGYHFSWSPGGATTQNINAATSTTLSTIIYTVTVTDTNGCSVKYPQVLKLKNPHFTVHDAYICPGGSSVFHISNGFGQAPLNYTWSPGGITGTTYTASSAGTYTAMQVDFNGCTVVDTFNLIQYPQPQANFSYTPTPPQQNSPVTFASTSTIASPDSVKWAAWAFGDGDSAIANLNPMHTYANGGTYTVTLVVASEFGCLATYTNTLNIEYVVTAPNIITPNGDGINEFLAFKNLQYFKNNKLWIYNRWGTQLYQNADYKNDWTGKDYSEGTYFYILDIPDKNQTLKGFFESIK